MYVDNKKSTKKSENKCFVVKRMDICRKKTAKHTKSIR